MASALTSVFCLVVAALVIGGAMFVVMITFVRVLMHGPGRKRIGEIHPTFRTARHLCVGEKAGIELRLGCARIEIESDKGNGLPAIAEWLLPFFPGPFGHFVFPGMLISRGPPLARSRAVQLRAREIEPADKVHAGREPKKSLGPKNTAQAALQ